MTSPTQFPRELDRCPVEACNNVLPATHIVAKFDDATQTGTARAICPNCRKCFEAKFRFMNAVAMLTEPVKEITDQRKIRGLRAAIDQLNGQLEATAA